jgi:hypothetical protein
MPVPVDAPAGDDRFRLVESREVIEVAIRTKAVKHVAVSQAQARRGNEEQAFAEPVQDALPPPAKDLGHGWILRH